MKKNELNKELFEHYNKHYKGKWGALIRTWRNWLDNNLNLGDSKEQKDNDLLNYINVSTGIGDEISDIIPMLIAGEIEVVGKQESRKWTVYYEQEPSFLIFRYIFWNGKRIDLTDEIDEIPFLTAEEAQKAPSFMKSLVKRGK